MLICNWKMFGDKALVQAYASLLDQKPSTSTPNIIVCPPFPLLSLFPKNVTLGAQNCHHESEGAFTGEVSAKLLAEMGCQYVLLGHSERRQYAGEIDALVAQKAETALRFGLTPIICVGSKAEDEEGVKQDIAQQFLHFSANLRAQFEDLNSIIIAYEPLWSIGTNLVPSIKHIQNIAAWIKTQGFSTVTYGGSVNAQNAADIRSVCDGVLVGRASLSVETLEELIST